MIRLNLGSGNARRSGFINIDIYKFDNVDIVHDIEKRLPFEDNSVDEIYCQHVLEHCSMAAVPVMLKDWYRILKINSIVNIVVPEIESCMKKFLEADETDGDKWKWKIEYILGGQFNQVGQQFHKSAYTKERLKILVKKAEFEIVKIDIIDNGRNNCIHLLALKK